MDEKTEYILLYETYKSMLTTHMCAIFELYYYSDLSYREIADNKGITYQAVRDTLKKALKLIEEYEEKLQLAYMREKINEITILLENDNFNNTDLKKIRKILKEIEGE